MGGQHHLVAGLDAAHGRGRPARPRCRRRRAAGPAATGGRSCRCASKELLVDGWVGSGSHGSYPPVPPGTPRRAGDHPFSPLRASGAPCGPPGCRASGRWYPGPVPDQPGPSSTGDTSTSPWLQSSESASLGRSQGAGHAPLGPDVLPLRPARCDVARPAARPVHRRHPGPERAPPHRRRPPARGAGRGRGGRAAASFVGRTGTSVDRRRLLVVRRRTLAPVLCEEIELRSSRRGRDRRTGPRWTWRPTSPTSSRSSRATPARTGRQRVYVDGDALCFDWVLGAVRRATSLRRRGPRGRAVRWRSTRVGSPGRSTCRRATA